MTAVCHPDLPHYAKGLCRNCRAKQRRRENPKPRSKYAPIEHGTSKGYQRHKYRGEKPCAPCLRAWRDEHRIRYRPHLVSDIPRIKESIVDVLSTQDRWLPRDILVSLVTDLHPEWKPESIITSVYRLATKGIVDMRIVIGQGTSDRAEYRADREAWERL